MHNYIMAELPKIKRQPQRIKEKIETGITVKKYLLIIKIEVFCRKLGSKTNEKKNKNKKKNTKKI